MNSPGIHVGPDRLIHLELIPHGAIHEADLAADGLESSSREEFVEGVPDLVARLQIETDASLRR
jgi:hypothetical protein